MNSSQKYPLHTIGEKLSVWYATDMYDKNLYVGANLPSAQNFKTESFTGEVVNSQWIGTNKPNTPYGWLFTVRLEDGSYRSLYECKCTMMQKAG